MKLNQLRTFVAVVESRSIHRGASTLGVSQPAVSATIRNLESAFGGPLLVRSAQGVQVTKLGALLLERGRAVLADMERLTKEMARLRLKGAGSVSVAVSSSVASAFLPQALKQFRAKMSDAQVKVSEIAGQRRLLAGLREGQFDFAVMEMWPHALPLPDDIECLGEAALPLVVGCRKSHPLAGAVTIGELADADWVLIVTDEDDRQTEAAKELARHGLTLNRQPVHCQSAAAALELIGAMDFIGLFVGPMADVNFGRYGLVQIDVGAALPEQCVGVFQRKAYPQTAPSGYLIDCFLKACGK